MQANRWEGLSFFSTNDILSEQMTTEPLQHPSGSDHYLGFFAYFSVIDQVVFFKDRKKLSQFDHDVRKYGVVSTVTGSFNAIIRQITEMSQRKKAYKVEVITMQSGNCHYTKYC